jgi:Tol biopolymer transport system component
MVNSENAQISDNGQFVVFRSNAANLFPLKTGANHPTGKEPLDDYWGDTFVHDLQTGETSLVSINSEGVRADNDSWDADISADGRFVVFATSASNLGECDQLQGCRIGVYIHDRQSGETHRVSKAPDGGQEDVDSRSPSISGDGNQVAFQSGSTNLIEGDTNESTDIFVANLSSGVIIRVSVDSTGQQANAPSYKPEISANGRFVVFESFADNLVPGDSNNTCDNNLDGISIENCPDIFLHDLLTGQTTLVSILTNGTQSDGWSRNATISGDGSVVAFASTGSNLDGFEDDYACDTDSDLEEDDNCPDVFLRNLNTGVTTIITRTVTGGAALGWADFPSLSASGRFVSFESDSEHLVEEDASGNTDIFVYDSQTGKNKRVSVSSTGTEANDNSIGSSISADGQLIAFTSYADNLVIGDTNENSDVFVHFQVITRLLHLPVVFKTN